MDILRGLDVTDDVANDEDDLDFAHEAAIDAPNAVGVDERRMQIRAYHVWASLLGPRALPSINDLSPEQMEDFGPNAVLLDFSVGLDDPAIVYLGAELRRECEVEGKIGTISQVPPRSLLSRLTDHYLQIIANAAPIGFEAEFVNQRDVGILYRGILMPFSSDGGAIDFVLGVINWKEMASQALSDAIAQELQDAQGSALATIAVDIAPGAVEMIAAQDLALNDGALGLDASQVGEDASLTEWLARAGDGADQARTSEARSQTQLFRAISLCHDFALVARARPADYATLLADAGIKPQARSPLAAIIKLVFGTDCDKRRITEYTTVLDHALAQNMRVGSLHPYLSDYEGGLKGLIRDVRAQRRQAKAENPRRRQVARSAMRGAAPLDPAIIPTDTDGLAVVIARREEDGSLAIVGALPEGSDLTHRVIDAAKS